MYDRKLDRQLCMLNKKYKLLKYNKSTLKKRLDIILKLLRCFKSLQFLEIYKEMKMYFVSKNFSLEGNSYYSNRSIQSAKNLSVAVYCCIIGGYDEVVDPVVIDDNVDYYCFTDSNVPSDSIWKKIDITEFPEYYELSPTELNRRIKMLPFEYLHNYDYTLYIDGNIQIVSFVTPLIMQMRGKGLGIHYHNERDCIYDESRVINILLSHKVNSTLLKKQINKYKKMGYPRHNGLFANTIIICDNNDTETISLMKKWWLEYKKYPTRDQISLPFVIWENNYSREKIYIMGDSVEMNYRFDKMYYHG